MAREVDEFPVIVWLDGSLSNQHWALSRDEMTLGRDEVCDIVIPVRQISRQHLSFRLRGGVCLVEDLNSKNGTWVNGYRLLGARALDDGDEIRVAKDIILRFVGSGATAPATTQGLPPFGRETAASAGRMRLDVERRQVYIGGRVLEPPLSLAQFRLLEALFASQGGVCTRGEVVQAVWPDVIGAGVSEQAIDALVRRLRDRLTELDRSHKYVVTVRGHGFRLDNPPESGSA